MKRFKLVHGLAFGAMSIGGVYGLSIVPLYIGAAERSLLVTEVNPSLQEFVGDKMQEDLEHVTLGNQAAFEKKGRAD